MTDIALLIGLIEKNPDSDISAAMLTDELMESRGMLRSEADRHVERVRADARTAKQIAFTAGLIRAKGPAFTHLCREVERVLLLDGAAGYTLYVISGDGPPRIGVRANELAVHFGRTGFAIALPAGWVCAWFRRNTHPIRPARKPKQR